LASLEALRKTRNADRVARALDALRQAAQTSTNVMPPILDAVRAYATVGEMCDTLRDVWGEYEEVPII
jgi:methylmalonyl-CoA mutase N-terminal domain/subunit